MKKALSILSIVLFLFSCTEKEKTYEELEAEVLCDVLPEVLERELKFYAECCKKYEINLDLVKLKEKLISDTYILEDKIGIELTEANQLIGLNKQFEHIIFIGTDINHFPPKRSNNFLFTSQIAQEYFCENNYFENSLLDF